MPVRGSRSVRDRSVRLRVCRRTTRASRYYTHRCLYGYFEATVRKLGRVSTALVGIKNHTFMASSLQRHV